MFNPDASAIRFISRFFWWVQSVDERLPGRRLGGLRWVGVASVGTLLSPQRSRKRGHAGGFG